MKDYHKKTWAERHSGGKRSEDRHLDQQRKHSGPSGRKHPACWSTEFVAVDGEGWTGSNGHHELTLLGSKDRSIQDWNGLTWQACFDFLLSLSGEGKTLIAFAFGYDFTMMVKHLPQHYLKRLWTDRQCWIGAANGDRYRVEYYPNKRYLISRYTGLHAEAAKSVCIYDTFGFFQSSFMKALIAHHIGTKSELARIQRMKERRGSFSGRQLDTIKRYNQLECKLLEQLMIKIQADVKEAGIRLYGWHGAGAVARAMLEQHRIKDILTDPPADMIDPILRAYFGGRIELIQPGYHPVVYAHDIRSAYPYAATLLPDFSRGEWSHERRTSEKQIREGRVQGLYRVRWSIDSSERLSPLPYRDKRRIHWANAGEGWYWGYEVAELIRIYGDQSEILETWEFHTDQPWLYPFTFLADYYELRQELKRSGNDAQKIIKLGMNAIYGKLAQGANRGKRPAFQSYLYAGLITSIARSKVFALAAQNPESIIAFATDGVFSTEPLDCDTSDQLGNWEVTQAANLYILQPGLYKTDSIIHQRGFKPGEIDWQDIERRMPTDALGYSKVLNVRRFVGLANGASRGAYDEIGEWLDSERKVSFVTPKVWRRGRLWNMDYSNEGLSAAYMPKGGDVAADENEATDYLEQLEQPDPVV